MKAIDFFDEPFTIPHPTERKNNLFDKGKVSIFVAQTILNLKIKYYEKRQNKILQRDKRLRLHSN